MKTVREEYAEMLMELKKLNKEDMTTPYQFYITHHTKKSQKMMWEHVNNYFVYMNEDAELGILRGKEFDFAQKVFNDMSRSVANMTIM